MSTDTTFPDLDVGSPPPEAVLAPEEIATLREAVREAGRETGREAPRADAAMGAEGMERLIGTSLASYERLPMIEVVYDRLVRILTTSLRNFTNNNVDVSCEHICSQRFGGFLEEVPERAIFGVFRAAEWDNSGLIVVGSSLVHAVVGTLLGDHAAGQSAEGGMPTRAHTTIERALIEPMISLFLDDLGLSFAPICAVNFSLERLETSARFAGITRPSNGVVTSRFRVELAGRAGEIDLIFPHATLEPVRDVLLQQFMGEKFGHDQIWEKHLASELWRTEVELEVLLEEQVLTLRELLSLKVGQRLALRREPSAPVRLRCGDRVLFEGRMGRRKGSIAVRIERTFTDGARGEDAVMLDEETLVPMAGDVP